MNTAHLQAEKNERLAAAAEMFERVKDSPEYKEALLKLLGREDLHETDLGCEIDIDQLQRDGETARYIVELLS